MDAEEEKPVEAAAAAEEVEEAAEEEVEEEAQTEAAAETEAPAVAPVAAPEAQAPQPPPAEPLKLTTVNALRPGTSGHNLLVKACSGRAMPGRDTLRCQLTRRHALRAPGGGDNGACEHPAAGRQQRAHRGGACGRRVGRRHPVRAPRARRATALHCLQPPALRHARHADGVHARRTLAQLSW
jgi:hypothetical protein